MPGPPEILKMKILKKMVAAYIATIGATAPFYIGNFH